MYIGEETAEKLGCYIWGYKKGMNDSGIPESPVLDFNKFTRWVREKYNYPGSAEIAGCEKSILAISLGISAEEIRWESFPTDVTNEQHRESVRLYISLINEYGQIENGT